MTIRSAALIQTLSLLALLALWQVTSVIVQHRVMPPPIEVFQVLLAGFEDGEIPYHIGITLSRVAASFLIAMVVGVAFGIAMGQNHRVDRFFDGWLVLFLNIPALVTIILCYVWFGLIEAAAIAAVAINKIPNVIVTIREGARSLSTEYREMAESFNLGRIKILRHVVLPQLFPFVLASARSGLALIWKIVLVVELLGRSDGVGFQLYTYFQLVDVASIFAYTLAFVAVVQIIELAGLQPLERRVNQWRR